jgi:hypothetical protein
VIKVCKKCGEEQPKTNFRSRGGKQKHLLKSHCNNCLKKDHERWVKQNKEAVRKYRAKDKWTLKKRCARHNITPEEFWCMYEEQDGTCPICDKGIEAESSAIDHNHKTGEVRGILCKSCNRALGLFGDSPQNLARAKSYLEESGYYG